MSKIDRTLIIRFIEREWIRPAAPEELDEQDIARIHLIMELQNDFGANDEAIPLILHLLDQLYALRSKVVLPGR